MENAAWLQRTITADGSHSLYHKALDEHYHSQYGALQESRFIYIDRGLRVVDKPEIYIFEMGLGTGLNCLLTFLESAEKKLKIHYTAIEAYPLREGIYQSLNYPQILGHSKAENIFYQIHQSDWEKAIALSAHFQLIKIQADIQDYVPVTSYDLIYYDAFGPQAQPELWTETIFQKLFAMLNKGGVLTTYCSKGSVRRTMQAAGFTVEKLPGPPGKREIVRAKIMAND